MEKEKILDLWRFGDDSAAARELSISPQVVQHWRTKGKWSKHENKIMEWAKERFAEQGRERVGGRVRLNATNC